MGKSIVIIHGSEDWALQGIGKKLSKEFQDLGSTSILKLSTEELHEYLYTDTIILFMHIALFYDNIVNHNKEIHIKPTQELIKETFSAEYSRILLEQSIFWYTHSSIYNFSSKYSSHASFLCSNFRYGNNRRSIRDTCLFITNSIATLLIH